MVDKSLSFDDLKKELPELKSRPGTSTEHAADLKKDQTNSELWRGNSVRDYVSCAECSFVRCIFIKYARGSKYNEGTKEEQEICWELLQTWKEEGGYICGNAPKVEPYLMRTQLRCWDAVESMYYSSGKDDICALCCNNEDVLTAEEVKYEKNLGGREPFPLCSECVKLKIQPPLKQGRAANFVEKGRQAKDAKIKKRTKAVNKGVVKAVKRKKK